MSAYVWMIVIALLSILGIFILWNVLGSFLVRRHASQYFAFRSFRALTTVGLTILTYLFAAKQFNYLIIRALNVTLGVELPEGGPDWVQAMAACFVLLVLGLTAVALHRTLASTQSPPVQLPDATSPGQKREARQTEAPAYAPKAVEQLIPWSRSAAELIQAARPTFFNFSESEWHPSHGLYISKVASLEGITAVYCPVNGPSKIELEDAVEWAVKLGAGSGRVLVAVDGYDGFDGKYDRQTLEIITREALLDLLLKSPDYDAYIINRWEHRRVVEGSELALKDIYVPSRATTRFRSENGEIAYQQVENLENDLIAWLEEQSNRQICILGEYGQGKSVLALKFTREIIGKKDRFRKFPILINLNGRSPRNQEPLGFLADAAAGLGIDARSVFLLHRYGRLVLILDGFDEMDLIGTQAMRLQHFRTLWEFALTSRSKVILTGRPNFFLDEHEVVTSVNVSEYPKDVPYSQAYYLEPFTGIQIKEALRNFPIETKTKIDAVLRAATSESRIIELLARPSTLFLAATLFRLEGATTKAIDRSAEIIERFLLHSYDRQLQKGVQFLSNEERKFFTLAIVLEMAAASASKPVISGDRMRKIVARHLEVLELRPSLQERLSGGKGAALQDRIERAFLVDSVFADVRSCGIFVPDSGRFGEYRLAHKSFFEVLAADLSLEILRLYCYGYQNEMRNSSLIDSISRVWTRRKPIKPENLLNALDEEFYGAGVRSLFSDRRKSTCIICRELIFSSVDSRFSSTYLADLALPWSPEICQFGADIFVSTIADALSVLGNAPKDGETPSGTISRKISEAGKTVSFDFRLGGIEQDELIMAITKYKEVVDGREAANAFVSRFSGVALMEFGRLILGIDCWAIPIAVARSNGLLDNNTLLYWEQGMRVPWRWKWVIRPLRRTLRLFWNGEVNRERKPQRIIEQLLLLGVCVCLDHGIKGATIFEDQGSFGWSEESRLVAAELQRKSTKPNAAAR